MKIDLKDIYRYVPFIYECDRCAQQYPIWMISNKDWKKGVKAMGRPNFGPAKHVCKQCFEEFNESPKYLTVDAYWEQQDAMMAALNKRITDPKYTIQLSPEERAYKRETVAALWDLLLPPYTKEEREEVIEKRGWPRGPFHKDKKV